MTCPDFEECWKARASDLNIRLDDQHLAVKRLLASPALTPRDGRSSSINPKTMYVTTLADDRFATFDWSVSGCVSFTVHEELKDAVVEWVRRINAYEMDVHNKPKLHCKCVRDGIEQANNEIHQD